MSLSRVQQTAFHGSEIAASAAPAPCPYTDCAFEIQGHSSRQAGRGGLCGGYLTDKRSGVPLCMHMATLALPPEHMRPMTGLPRSTAEWHHALINFGDGTPESAACVNMPSRTPHTSSCERTAANACRNEVTKGASLSQIHRKCISDSHTRPPTLQPPSCDAVQSAASTAAGAAKSAHWERGHHRRPQISKLSPRRND